MSPSPLYEELVPTCQIFKAFARVVARLELFEIMARWEIRDGKTQISAASSAFKLTSSTAPDETAFDLIRGHCQPSAISNRLPERGRSTCARPQEGLDPSSSRPYAGLPDVCNRTRDRCRLLIDLSRWASFLRRAGIGAGQPPRLGADNGSRGVDLSFAAFARFCNRAAVGSQ